MIRRRVLARQLLRLMREEAGLTVEEAAPKLDFSVSKLSRIENAQVVIDVHWVKSMLDVYDIGGDRWTELMDLARAPAPLSHRVLGGIPRRRAGGRVRPALSQLAP
jgi:transcriptional regulator with XRE-family HTH domain